MTLKSLWLFSFIVGTAALPLPAHAQDLPAGEGREILKAKCTACHSLNQAVGARLSAEEWNNMVGSMILMGADVNDNERPVLVEYLGANFGDNFTPTPPAASTPAPAPPTSSGATPSLWSHFKSVSEGQPGNGQTLLAYTIDLSGDGKPEIFLTSQSTCGNASCTWDVYSPTDKPDEVKYLGEALLGMAFALDAGRHAIAYCAHTSAEECELGEITITGQRVTNRDLGPCRNADAGCRQRLEEIKALTAASPGQLIEADFSTDPTVSPPKWRAPSGAKSTAIQQVPAFERLQVIE